MTDARSADRTRREGREFQVECVHWAQVRALPSGWTPARLMPLLDSLEVEGVEESDALEMTLMALQDRDLDEAADCVLQAVFGDTMRRGVRENLSHEIQEDRPWEDFAELSQQAGIFDAVVLLQQAFPLRIAKPGAVSITVRVQTASGAGRSWLDADTVDAALLLRILAAGMDDRAMLRRVFDDALAGSRFPEAGGILWHVSRGPSEGTACEFTIVSSHPWFDPLEDTESWTAQAWPDAPTRAEE
ncbi:MAG: hypothetical protein HKN20_08470 [Gemmatimonadetes bacterium]|nr:hypothetical protein [Gemmatimonadota bacterium]